MGVTKAMYNKNVSAFITFPSALGLMAISNEPLQLCKWNLVGR